MSPVDAIFVNDLVATGKRTRPSALGMSDPIWGPLIHIFVDERRSAKDKVFRPSKL